MREDHSIPIARSVGRVYSASTISKNPPCYASSSGSSVHHRLQTIALTHPANPMFFFSFFCAILSFFLSLPNMRQPLSSPSPECLSSRATAPGKGANHKPVWRGGHASRFKLNRKKNALVRQMPRKSTWSSRGAFVEGAWRFNRTHWGQKQEKRVCSITETSGAFPDEREELSLRVE